MASITTKQRAARKRNIKVAQMAKSKNKKGGGKGKSSFAEMQKALSGIRSPRGSSGKRGSKAAFSKAYKKSRKGGNTKSYSVAKGHSAMKARGGNYARKKIRAYAKKGGGRDYHSLLRDLY